MVRILILLVVVAAAAFFTNPTSEAHAAKAREELRAAAEADLQELNIGGVITNSATQLVEGDYETFYLLSRYSTPSAENPVIVCYGAFTMISCSPAADESVEPEEPAKS